MSIRPTPLRETLRVATHPGAMVIRPVRTLYAKRYQTRLRTPRLSFALDAVLVLTSVALAVLGLVFLFLSPTRFEDKILLEADVAPRELISGGESTLVISYTNGTDETLEDTRMLLRFPQQFIFYSVQSETQETDARELTLGNIAPGQTGRVKIRGVLFGAIGQPQVVRSILTFTHGPESEPGQKLSFHSFTPSRSAFQLLEPQFETPYVSEQFNITIPWRFDGAEAIETDVQLKNASLIDTTVPRMRDRVVELGKLTPGQGGEIVLHGRATIADITLELIPRFVFGNVSYEQTSFIFNATAQRIPVTVSQTIEVSTFSPGQTVTSVVRVNNASALAIKDIHVSVESASPFFLESEIERVDLEPNAARDVSVTWRLRSRPAFEADNLSTLTSHAIAWFDITPGRTLTATSPDVSRPLTTAFALESFGRYATPQGEQIGRGPLPPAVGEETRYWIFWNVTQTTSSIETLDVRGVLPSGVRFTGRKTVSQGGSVLFNTTTREVTWRAEQLDPTAGPGAKRAGVGFELGITPTEAQLGTSPTLIRDIVATARDSKTGATLHTSGSPVTTRLPSDSLAGPYPIVE